VPESPRLRSPEPASPQPESPGLHRRRGPGGPRPGPNGSATRTASRRALLDAALEEFSLRGFAGGPGCRPSPAGLG